VAEFNRDPAVLRRRLLWLGGYLWVHRGYSDTPEGAVDLLLSAPSRGENDVLVGLAVPWLLARLPAALTEVKPGEGEVAVDMRVTLGFAHDSVGQHEEALLTAARRGLKAVVIAGRGELGDARKAGRVAERLRKQGRLPADFRVIVGEYIQSRAGLVLGAFLQDRVLEGMTISETVKDIHRQGGLAYLARPGDLGAVPPLRQLPFDGYLIQAGNFELFRTLHLLDDPGLRGKQALYGSNLVYPGTVGLPFSNVPLVRAAADPLYAGLAEHQGYAAGALYLPWMMFLLTRPVATYQGTLNRYFDLNDRLTLHAVRLLGADNVVVRTSWDDEMRDLISLGQAPGAIGDLWNGDSPLLHFPRLTYLEAEYGRLAIGYDYGQHAWQAGARWRW
jgi:hypothetical protein